MQKVQQQIARLEEQKDELCEYVEKHLTENNDNRFKQIYSLNRQIVALDLQIEQLEKEEE